MIGCNNLLALVSIGCQSYAFTAPRSVIHPMVGARSVLPGSNFANNDEDSGEAQFYDDFGGAFIGNDSAREEAQFYDDFGGVFIGNSSPENSDKLMDSLQTKVLKTREVESANEAKMTRNWRRGNWSVRGFALAKQNSSTDEQELVHVSAVAAPISASLGGFLMSDDNTNREYRTVAVGRTDGSVFLVRLGQEYMTKFASAPKLIENIQGEDLSFRVEQKWYEQDQIRTADEIKLQPFEILLDFQSSEMGEECHTIVYHDISEERNDGYICTASGDTGVVSMWALPLPGQQLQSTSLSGGHQARIVSLKTAVLQSPGGKEQHILISASCDGTVSFWDIGKQGTLLLSCKCVPDDAVLTCADVSNPYLERSYIFSDDNKKVSPDMIFVGTSDGYVMGYGLKKILSYGECNDPIVSFRAHGLDSGKGRGITAIKCGGEGTLENKSSQNVRGPNVSSQILLTGGDDGSVKQWYVHL